MAFDVGFGIFVALMLVLAGFVVRFAVQLNRQERPTRRRMPPRSEQPPRSGG